MESELLADTELAAAPADGAPVVNARPRLSWGRALAIVGVLALVALLTAGLINSSRTRPMTGVAPELTLAEYYPGYDAGYPAPLSLNDLRGKIVIVNFWASWCVPCREEADLLEQTWRRYQDQGVVLLGVGYNDTEPEALAYLKEFDVTYPNGPDLRGVISRRYRVEGVPETFFLNRAGEIVHVEIGPLRPAKLESVLQKLLEE